MDSFDTYVALALFLSRMLVVEGTKNPGSQSVVSQSSVSQSWLLTYCTVLCCTVPYRAVPYRAALSSTSHTATAASSHRSLMSPPTCPTAKRVRGGGWANQNLLSPRLRPNSATPVGILHVPRIRRRQVPYGPARRVVRAVAGLVISSWGEGRSRAETEAEAGQRQRQRADSREQITDKRQPTTDTDTDTDNRTLTNHHRLHPSIHRSRTEPPTRPGSPPTY